MTGIKPPKTKSELIDMYYHQIRSHLLEVASAFDRIDRASGTVDGQRLDTLRQSAAISVDGQEERARRILELLSVR